MSAKEAHQRLTFPLDRLPDELLAEVLRHATWVPYGIAPSDLVMKQLESTQAKKQRRDYMQSLVTKRYLVRVCKKWYRLAYMFLYEWVFVGKLKNLQGLILTIEQLASNEPEHRTLIGWYTKRLDINIRLTGGEVIDLRSALGALFLRLLRNLDSLEVLVVGECPDKTWLCPSVSHSWGPKLQILNYQHDNPILGSLDTEVWVCFLRSHPHIISLKPSLTRLSKKPFAPLGFSHSLLSYSTYNMNPIPITLFTSLQKLGISLYESRYTRPDWQDHFITRPLPSLTVLQLNFLHGVSPNLSAVRGLIHRFMPNLQRINLVLSTWPAIWLEGIFPETVKVLGVRICSTRPSKQLAKFLLQKLAKIVHHHGSRDPLVIHFLDRGTLDGLLPHREYLMRHAQKEGDILERWIDCDGCECRISNMQ